MTAPPVRVQLSRRKGWRMPPNTVKVDRTTRWGNPCVVGKHGTRAECVKWLSFAMEGSYVMGMKTAEGEWLSESLIAYAKAVRRDARRLLRGKNLACWCPLDGPCHADLLLEIANR